jgi:hypothetical protein
VGGLVTAKNDSIHDSNDNDDIGGVITDNQLSGCDSTCELTEGTYYLEEIDLDSGEELVLDLSDGNIALAVSGPISVEGDIRVENPDDGRANIYMDATTLGVRNGAAVTVPDHKSGSLRIYGPPGVEAELSDSRFVGMLYAPDSRSQHGTISVTTHAEVFGALVGGETAMKSGGVVHYDSALARSTTLPKNYQSAPRVTYMHVTVNRVNVSSV